MNWISVEKELPPKSTDVLVWYVKSGGWKEGITQAGMFYDGGLERWVWMGWENEDAYSGEVTHWMPLPKGPN